jgi:DNA-binding transcriptional LysR family regulator
MVEQGLGVSFLPHLVAHECLKKGALRVIGVAELPPLGRDIFAVLTRG